MTVASTNGRGPSCSASTSTVPTEIDFDQLSPRGTAIARQIGTRLLEGYSPREIGKEIGISGCSVSSLLDELREELAGR